MRAGPVCAGSEFAPLHARAGKRYRDVDPAARTEMERAWRRARGKWTLSKRSRVRWPPLVSAKSLKGNWLWREDSNLRPPGLTSCTNIKFGWAVEPARDAGNTLRRSREECSKPAVGKDVPRDPDKPSQNMIASETRGAHFGSLAEKAADQRASNSPARRRYCSLDWGACLAVHQRGEGG